MAVPAAEMRSIIVHDLQEAPNAFTETASPNLDSTSQRSTRVGSLATKEAA